MQLDTDYKTITYSNYSSVDSTGTVTFNADSTCSSSDLSYNAFSAFNSYNYKNGLLVDSSSMPFNLMVDSSNSTGNYELIGNDSIAHTADFFPLSSNAVTQNLLTGGRYSISGNTLTITELYHKDTALVISGISNATTESGKFIITLQKQ